MKRAIHVSAVALIVLGLGSAARADIALLSTGTTLKVTAQRRDGDTVFLSLKGGGEVGVAASALRGVVPDEVTTDGAAAYPPALAAVLPPVLHETGKRVQ